MEALEEAIGQVAPAWRPKGPTGGFIASELKKVHDDSLSVFPESVYSGEGRRKGRWATTMKDDYIPIAAMRAQAERRNAHAHLAADDCGVSGTLGGGNQSMFQKWKVPSHVTEAGSGRGTRASVDQLADQVEEIRLGSPTRAPSALPEISGATPRPATQNSAVLFRPASKHPQRHRHPKSMAAKLIMDKYQVKEERSTAERWLAQAPESDKEMVAKALKVNGGQTKVQDVVTPVKDWLKEASPKEREVALTFFQSLAGTQLMGGSMEKKQRVDEVINLLRNPPNKYATNTDVARASLTSSQRLRHLNVLTPATRKNKWRHQTWHHLPSYSNKNKVVNKSSILIEPHSTVHRHFTIHPDWGP